MLSSLLKNTTEAHSSKCVASVSNTSVVKLSGAGMIISSWLMIGKKEAQALGKNWERHRRTPFSTSYCISIAIYVDGNI